MNKFLVLIMLLCTSYVYSAEQVIIKKKILALGDSLTEGYGVDPKYSYPSQLERKLQLNGFKYKVINGGVSGSTTASGMSRLKWFMKAKPSHMILALGGNDGLRGLKIEASKKNLNEVILMAKKSKIKVILAAMQMPPNYGKEYRQKFKNIYYDLAKEHKLTVIPFVLKGVAGKKEFNIEDGIHPNSEGYKIVTENIYKILKELL